MLFLPCLLSVVDYGGRGRPGKSSDVLNGTCSPHWNAELTDWMTDCSLASLTQFEWAMESYLDHRLTYLCHLDGMSCQSLNLLHPEP